MPSTYTGLAVCLKLLPHLHYGHILHIHTALNNRERQPPSVDAAYPPPPAHSKPPKLLDQVRRCIRDKHYSLRTEEAYAYWIRWYIRFHAMKHPMDMGVDDIKRFLSYLSNERQVSVSTHKQALCALLFLYKQVLQTDFPWLDDSYRPS